MSTTYNLSIREVQRIFRLKYSRKFGIRRIAKHVGRSPSTISRLLRRYQSPSKDRWRRKSVSEKIQYALNIIRRKKSVKRKRLRLRSQRIRKIVCWLLTTRRWSPEDISYFFKTHYKKHKLKISAKSIYNFIKHERSALKEYLFRKGKPYRQQVSHPRALNDMRNIRHRPSIIEEGHWEIDTVVSGRVSKGGVLVLRELKSRKAFFFLIPTLEADGVSRIVLRFFQKLPGHMRKTLTGDNGTEFSSLVKVEKVCEEIQVYFCDAYSAWQKGSVENVNGRLRHFFPKKTDFSKVSEEQLKKVQNLINYKPMQLHGGKSPKIVFDELLKAA